jgi:hypothetical protein
MCIVGSVVLSGSKDRPAFIFRVKQFKSLFFDCLTLKTKTLPSTEMSGNTHSHSFASQKTLSSATSLCEPLTSLRSHRLPVNSQYHIALETRYLIILYLVSSVSNMYFVILSECKLFSPSRRQCCPKQYEIIII